MQQRNIAKSLLCDLVQKRIKSVELSTWNRRKSATSTQSKQTLVSPQWDLIKSLGKKAFKINWLPMLIIRFIILHVKKGPARK